MLQKGCEIKKYTKRIRVLTVARGRIILSDKQELDIIDVEDTNLATSSSSVSMANKMQSLWNITPSAMQDVAKSARTFRMSHGMFAGVPILCKDTNCPYANVCTVDSSNRLIGQRCPMEAGAIMGRFDMWCRHFGIDMSNPTDEDTVDIATIRDLVDIEVQVLRADNRIAINADFMGKTINTVDNKGKPWYEETVTPMAEYKLTLMDKKYKLLQLLNSTRKDKAAMAKNKDNPSIKAIGIFQKINGMLGDGKDLLSGFDQAAISVDVTESKGDE